MSITPNTTPPEMPAPEPAPRAASVSYQPPVVTATPPSKLPLIALVIAVLGLAGLFFYAKSLSDRLDQMKTSMDSAITSQGQTLEKLSQRINLADGRTNDLQGKFTVAENRLGMTQSELQKAHQIAADLAKQQQESAQQLSSQIGQLQQEQVSTKGAVGSLSNDVVGVKGEVTSTKQDLAATKSQLQRVVGDLGVQSDLIAHNKGELDELRLRGEREYVEFDVRKTNKSQRVGNIQLELKKTDPKKLRYTVTLVADDKPIEKRDKTVAEPVQFYQQGNHLPSELVVNQIYKDRIVGYISTPKVKDQRTPMKAPS